MTTTNERDLYYARRLAEMIRCKTVSRKEGFEPEEFLKLRRVIGTLFPLVTEKAERTILGEDAYLYKLPGKDPGRNVLLMSHHDVVEATGSWQEAPFAGVIRGGKLWGRGTVDTKTPLFAEFSALEELLLEGFEFPVNVYLFSSHNEEYSGDGALLAHDYFIGHNIRFDWISDEGGAVIAPPMPGIGKKCAMIAVHEKGRCTAQLIAEPQQGHAGLAGAHRTPVMRMAAFMTEVDEKKPFIRLMPKLNAAAGEMLGTGCTFKNVSTDDDGTCRAQAFLRCINDADFAEDLDTLREMADRHGVQIVLRDEDNEYYKPTSLDSRGYQHVKETAQAVFPYAAVAPFILPAGTDARRFTDLSDAVIRFAPIDIDDQQYASVHGENENISIDKLPIAVDFYKALLRNYA